MVKSTPDPVTRAAGLRAGCTPLGSGELRNPWRCSISYASGRDVQHRVTLTASGAYTGDDEIISYQGQTQPDTGVINGCCVTIPSDVNFRTAKPA